STSAVNLWERIKPAPGASGNAGILGRFKDQPLSYFGMLLAHCGIAVFIIGVTAVKSFETEKDVKMEVADTVAVGGYTFTFRGVKDVVGVNYLAARGSLEVSKNG